LFRRNVSWAGRIPAVPYVSRTGGRFFQLRIETIKSLENTGIFADPNAAKPPQLIASGGLDETLSSDDETATSNRPPRRRRGRDGCAWTA
jgi:hypothetical protein